MPLHVPKIWLRLHIGMRLHAKYRAVDILLWKDSQMRVCQVKVLLYVMQKYWISGQKCYQNHQFTPNAYQV